MGDLEGYQSASYVNNGTQAAKNKGAEYGVQSGAGDARNTWISALDRGIPQADPQPKANLSFTDSPYANPYASFNPAPLSLEQMAWEAKVDASRLSIYNYQDSRLCGDRSLLRDRNSFSMKGYYRADGRYRFDRNRALDGKLSMNGPTVN
jgi:hypothetical protein